MVVYGGLTQQATEAYQREMVERPLTLELLAYPEITGAVTEEAVVVRPVALLTAASTEEQEESQAVEVEAVELAPILAQPLIITEATGVVAKLGFGHIR